MTELSWKALRQQVHERARRCCEYCQTGEANIGQAMHVEHISPNGGDGLENLCLACSNCNLSKGVATAAIDLENQEEVPLFNPRQQQWREHFRWVENGIRVEGLTPIGRATIERLKMNQNRILIARRRWVQGGFHPPAELNTEE